MINPSESRSRKTGFTLVELAVVLLILAIGAGIAVVTLQRSRARQEASKAVIDLSAIIRKARSITRIAGPRIGTSRLIIDPSCVGSGPELNVTVTPGSQEVLYPAEIRLTAPDQVTVSCATWTAPGAAGAQVTITDPTGPMTFAFTSQGRLIGPPVGVLFQEPYTGLARGVLVMSSGLVCESSLPAAQASCDEEPQ